MNVALFDYGAGNLHSLKKALETGGARVTVTPSWDEALGGDALVLPGVGSFGAAVAALDGSQDRVREALEEGLPTLGICLGMQLLFDDSDEGGGRGIGLIPGRVRVLKSRTVPQMGWNEVDAGGDGLFSGVDDLVAYFANSYVCEPRDPGTVIATTRYQGDHFASAVRRSRSWGVQFHPEKSSRPGLRVIRNFLEMTRSRGGRP
ncbi:MAG: imidazole glycerol phosphate synthase subunit HisH [Gemmatimonadota bacterium]